MTRDEFETWFAGPVENLKSNQNNGFIVIMLCCAMVEAYARAKDGGYSGRRLKKKHIEQIAKCIGISADLAQVFWAAFRHGLFHRLVLQGRTLKATQVNGVFIHHEGTDAVKLVGDELAVNPGALADAVLSALRADITAINAIDTAEIRSPSPSVQP
ncbi:MAG: hypothetical protein KC594_18970, partial [Nitrospira sp.]|nr:hypothetical protein [Nitrospira sp.]